MDMERLESSFSHEIFSCRTATLSWRQEGSSFMLDQKSGSLCIQKEHRAANRADDNHTPTYLNHTPMAAINTSSDAFGSMGFGSFNTNPSGSFGMKQQPQHHSPTNPFVQQSSFGSSNPPEHVIVSTPTSHHHLPPGHTPELEKKATAIIQGYLSDCSINPYKGSVPLERIQNIFRAKHSDLYEQVFFVLLGGILMNVFAPCVIEF